MSEPSEDFDWEEISRREGATVTEDERRELVRFGMRRVFEIILPKRSRKMIASDIRALALRGVVMAFESKSPGYEQQFRSLAHIAEVFGVNRQRVSAVAAELRRSAGMSRRVVITHKKSKRAVKKKV